MDLQLSNYSIGRVLGDDSKERRRYVIGSERGVPTPTQVRKDNTRGRRIGRVSTLKFTLSYRGRREKGREVVACRLFQGEHRDMYSTDVIEVIGVTPIEG